MRITVPISSHETKELEAFELQEEIDLLKYCAITDVIVKSPKSNYDNNTIRNLIIISLFSLTRIGELGALNYKKHMDIFFSNSEIINLIIQENTLKKQI